MGDQCEYHSDIQNDINGLAKLAGALRKEAMQNSTEMHQRLDRVDATLDNIYNRLFVSNGDISIVEEIRTIKGDHKRHLTEHTNNRDAQIIAKKDWKYLITTGIAILGLAVALAYPRNSQHNEKIEKIEKVVNVLLKKGVTP